MPDPVDPRAFLTEYVEPAMVFYRNDFKAAHLAAHAIAQMDILAAVVANYKQLNESTFRRQLGRRLRILQVIRDAHDAHKHGKLFDTDRNFAYGIKPETETSYGWFYGISLYSGPPIEMRSTFLVLRDGTKIQIDFLLNQALQIWKNEFAIMFAPIDR